MELSKEIEFLKTTVREMQIVLEQLQERLEQADKAWPDHQIVQTAEWRNRSEIPPAGKVWYSDGVRVWLIHSDGTGMGGSPDVCRYWTTAYIPAPPSRGDVRLTVAPAAEV